MRGHLAYSLDHHGNWFYQTPATTTSRWENAWPSFFAGAPRTYMLVSLVKRLSTLNRKVNIHWMPMTGNEGSQKSHWMEDYWISSQPYPFKPPQTYLRSQTSNTGQGQGSMVGAVGSGKTRKRQLQTPEGPGGRCPAEIQTRQEGSVLLQARTGKIGFRVYLAKIGVKESADCPLWERSPNGERCAAELSRL